jgi:hypothetical protein
MCVCVCVFNELIVTCVVFGQLRMYAHIEHMASHKQTCYGMETILA